MEEIVVLQTHIDYSQDSLSLEISTPQITIFGNTMDCTPIQVKVGDFVPYFYIQPSSPISMEATLETAISKNFKKAKFLGLEAVHRKNIYGYSEETSLFYKVYFNNPNSFRAAKTFFESGLMLGHQRVKFKVFESNFPYILRFMNDHKLSGMSYLKISNYKVESKHPLIISTETPFIEQLPFKGEYDVIIPLKILSIDIECCSQTRGFPDAKKDPLIQIGNSVSRYGTDGLSRAIFCLKETANIPNSNVYWFETEKELLNAWKEYFMSTDPDIVIGYNIKSFDFPYILDRAEALGLKDFEKLGRTDKPSKVVNKQQSSSMFGTFDAKDINIEGRLIFDLLHIIRREHKLRSYSLNSVSVHFLGDQKEDVPHSSILDLQNGNKETRARIASYCLHDTFLPMQIFDKLNVLINYSELARATYVPIGFFSTRGAAIKVLTQIYREASGDGYLVPDMDVVEEQAPYEGGFVLDPLRGFYNDPIAVMDFTSLYPSIIIAKNLCYTTLLTKNQYIELGGHKTPTGNYFCASDVKEGLLPKILKNLLRARREAKTLLKKATDPILKKGLDARQYALKICANSLYGFTGSPSGQLPCIEISQSTTAFGRDMIAMTKKMVEENFNRSKGFTHDAQVIYGDTDSVMINFFEQDLKKVFEMSRHVSEFISERFEKPVSLEFEKVYSPYLLINKKRYAGLIYTNPDKPDKIDTKGIETVRRDNCELVKVVIENCLNKILLQRDVEAAKEYVRRIIGDLYTDKIDLSQLVISKTFTKSNYVSRQAHTELAERLKKRGQSVGIGDRIPYVIVKGDRKMAAYEKSEDPVYVLENNLPIDKEYYIEQQLFKPVQRLFDPIMDDVSSLFHGEHTKVISRGVSMQGPLNLFVKTTDECVGCKKPGTILCVACRPNFSELFMTIQRQFNEKTTRFSNCWTECQRCMGSVVNEVLCINRVCPIFYMRTRVKKELGPLGEKLFKLKNISW